MKYYLKNWVETTLTTITFFGFMLLSGINDLSLKSLPFILVVALVVFVNLYILVNYGKNFAEEVE